MCGESVTTTSELRIVIYYKALKYKQAESLHRHNVVRIDSGFSLRTQQYF